MPNPSSANLLRASFAAGEISPRLQGRVDLDIYKKGLRRLENFVVASSGGIEFRRGSAVVAVLDEFSR